MSDTKKRTNPLIRFIGNSLGLATHEEIEETVKKAIGVSTANRPELRNSMIIGQAIPPDMKMEDYLKAYTGWVFACVDVISKETADIELTLYKRKGQNTFDIVDAHPVLDLLYKVNPLYTSYLLWEATEAYMKLVGEAFWWVVGPTNNPREIWILRPDWINVKDSKAKLIDHYEYGPPGDKKINIPFEQMVHFKDFNPRNNFRGYGNVKAGAKSIDENTFQQDYSRNFFYNSALPGGALTTENNLQDEQYERIRDDWEATHRGSKKAWKVAILEAGLKWQDIGVNHKEMDFIEGRKMTRDEVLAMFRVPKPLLTFDDVNRAAAKEARAILLENVVTHEMKRITSFLNEFLLPRYGDEDLFFGYKDPVPNDQTATLARYDNALRHGWMTRNEVRELEDLEPIDGGDKLLIPFSLQDIGAQKTPEQTQTDAYKRFIKGINVRIPQYPYMKAQLDQFQRKIETLAENLIRTMINKRNAEGQVVHKQSTFVEGIVVKSDEEREAHWRTIISRTDPREAKYKHILTDLFTDQEQRVQAEVDQGVAKKAVTTGKTKATSPVAVEDLVVRDSDIFATTTMDFIRSVIEAEGIQQIQSIVDQGIFYMQSAEVQKYLKKEGVKYVKALNEETAEQLRDTLAEGVSNQESISQLKARVTKVYDDAKGYRAERIARSEVLRATNFATEEAYKQSKVVEKKEWLTAHDERTCPWCAPMDGKAIELKEVFYEQGDTVTGTNDKGKKVYLNIGVSNISHPPLHPNCRCTLVPVISTDEKSITKKDLLRQLTNATIKELKDKN